MEDEIKSPYVPEATPETPAFDYNQYQMETTGKAMGEIYKAIGESVELLTYGPESTKENIRENLTKASNKIRDILVSCKVPVADLQSLTDSIQSTMQYLFGDIIREKREFEKEILARVVDARDPGFPDKCSPEYMTLGDMYATLKKLQDEQGVDHFYHITSKAE